MKKQNKDENKVKISKKSINKPKRKGHRKSINNILYELGHGKDPASMRDEEIDSLYED